jgi:hypothetical protein
MSFTPWISGKWCYGKIILFIEKVSALFGVEVDELVRHAMENSLYEIPPTPVSHYT